MADFYWQVAVHFLVNRGGLHIYPTHISGWPPLLVDDCDNLRLQKDAAYEGQLSEVIEIFWEAGG